MEPRAAEYAAARPRGRTRIHRHQGHGPGRGRAAQSRLTGSVRAQRAAEPADRQRHAASTTRLPAPIRASTPAGAPDAALRARHVRHRALHLLESDRRRLQLQRHGRHHGPVHRQSARLERGLSTFDQRHHLHGHVPALLAGGRSRHAAQRRLEDHARSPAGRSAAPSCAASGTPLTARVGRQSREHRRHRGFGTGRARSHRTCPSKRAATRTSICWPSPRRLPGQYGNAGRDTIPGPFSIVAQRLAEPLLPLRRIAPPVAVSPQRQQRAESRGDHRLRHHGQFVHLRAADRRLGHADRHACY